MAEYIIEMGDALYNEETGEAVFKPTIKQKLIRCNDCINYSERDGHHHCYIGNGTGSGDAFCSYAERRDDA